MTDTRGRRRGCAAGTVIVLLAAVMGIGLLVGGTLAQRAGSQFAATEFHVTMAPDLELEGSVDGTAWESGEASPLRLEFDPDELALQVGEENAVYAPMFVRAGAASNAGATATVVENGLGNSDFADALRGEVFEGAAGCDAVGVASAQPLTTGTTLRGQATGEFEIAAPEPLGQPGEATELCVKVWLNDNNWLLGGTMPPTETATWTVTGVTS